MSLVRGYQDPNDYAKGYLYNVCGQTAASQPSPMWTSPPAPDRERGRHAVKGTDP